MEYSNIKQTEIKGLFNKYNFKIDGFQENRLLLVAFNGAFKSTILKMIYLFLSAQLEKLDKIEFDTMSVIFINETRLDYEQGESKQIIKNLLTDRINSLEINSLPLSNFSKEKISSIKEIELEYLLQDEPNSKENLLQIKKEVLSKIFPQLSNWTTVYLPTFRVVERDFEEIYEGIESISKKNANSVFREQFPKLSIENKTSLENLFMKIWTDFNKESKKLQVNTIEFFDYGMQKVRDLMIAQNISERETKLQKFVTIVNKYFEKDKFLFPDEEDEDEEVGLPFDTVYNSLQKRLIYENREVKIVSKVGNRKVELEYLSSGEKQIITLFANLILTDIKNFFIIYDEPELSLSILWQENLIVDVMELPNVIGVLSATHSPNVIKKLLSYSRDLTDFMGVSE